MKILLDTNIILDALMNRVPWAKSAQEIMLAIAEDDDIEACITSSAFTDIYYILKKYLKDKAQTKTALLNLLTVIKVLDVTGKDCEDAFKLPMPDYEDALQAYCAHRHRVDNIITRNEEDFDNSPVKAISPEALLKKLQV